MKYEKVITVTSPSKSQSFSYFTNLAVFVLASVFLQTLPFRAQHPFLLVALQAIIVWESVTILKSIHKNQKRHEVCSIRILPFGIQIEEYALLDNTESFRVEDTHFIPRDNILDMVVVEIIISSSKVSSSIILRTIHPETRYQSHEDKLKQASLAVLFDPVKFQLTYEECTVIWKALCS